MPTSKVLPGGHPLVAYGRPPVDTAEVLWRARSTRDRFASRRTVRMFSDQPVPQQVIEDVLLAASTAPSGAHQQPWTFVAISDPVLKHEIRVAAQAEEVKNYAGRMPPAWLQALAPLGTDPDKPHLEVAPWVVVVFAQKHGVDAQGEPIKHYYVRESVGMACGMLAAAVHQAGLVTLTHTPSPMAFLGKLLDRPRHEQAYVVMPIGHPASDCVVPDIQRKSLEQVAVFHTNEHDRPRALTRADRDALAASEDPG